MHLFQRPDIQLEFSFVPQQQMAEENGRGSQMVVKNAVEGCLNWSYTAAIADHVQIRVRLGLLKWLYTGDSYKCESSITVCP